MTPRPVLLTLLAFALCAPTAPADVISYLRFEGQATDETGLMDGELLNFNNPEVEGWSGDVFAPIIPLTGQANTGSIRFAGGSEFVDLSNNNAVDLGTTFTVEFFMKPDQPSIYSGILALSPQSTLTLALTESSGDLYFNMEFMDQTPYTPATGVETGTWQHVALVKQPGEYSLYLNGTLIANAPVSSSADGPYFFPGTGNTGDRVISNWRGWLDELRISDTALTPDQFLIAVPEPGTIVLCFSGLATLFLFWQTRRFC
jgi:hypothetical protein